MRHAIGFFIIIFLHSLLPYQALAKGSQSALVPLPSIDDFSKGDDGWGFGLGLGVEYESAYEGSDEYGFEADPAGGVQWRSGENVFFWAGETLGWRGLRSEHWLFEVAVGFDEGREQGDSDEGHLNGLGDNDESTELILQVRRDLSAHWRYWLDGRLVATDEGSLALFGVGHRFGEQNDGSGHELSAALVWHDGDYANKEFGINQQQSVASGLEPTNLSGGFRSVGFNYHYRMFMNEDWQIFAEALYEQYFGDIKDSPIARNSYEAEVGIGFIYVF
ncbi:MipA/OmpV family protein [Pseudoalteromonas sp. SSDWG2]|uniref:MipA/OmpV family protein n=1 Tax=Pseudoalteromonas sp. SSDWG2 TaxID=3139391 RepID=UPI003BAA2C97